jgi:hypothetical protein
LLCLLLSIVTSLLPHRYRWRLGWAVVTTPGAIISGVAELVTCLGFLVYRYIMFANYRMRSIPTHVVLGAAEKGGKTAVMAIGLIIFA